MTLPAREVSHRAGSSPAGLHQPRFPGVHLLSLNIGQPRRNPWKGLAATGIDKRPVRHSVAVTAPGPKGTGAVGLAGDRAHDVKHHGGADQALYAYAREDLDTWQDRLGRRLDDGACFGENLTTVGLDVNGALIGERWRIGPTSCSRSPARGSPASPSRGGSVSLAGSSASSRPASPARTCGSSTRAASAPVTPSKSSPGRSTTSRSP